MIRLKTKIKKMSCNKVYKLSSNYTEWYLNKNSEINLGFLKWIEQVERKVIAKYGFTLIDLPDEDYILYYEQKSSSDRMVQIIEVSNNF